MITFKKREIVYRPYEPYLKLIIDIAMIICAAYLITVSFFHSTTVYGYSMEGTLKDNDVVLIDEAIYRISDPKRYDIIVFEADDKSVADKYVKRIIALPGETVQIINGYVYIDGKLLSDDVFKDFIHNAGIAGEAITLAEDEYFVLGDNRNNSDDSRFSNVGLVKYDTIIGKAWVTVYPLADFSLH